ncbi:hypothetical protein JCM10213v2_009208 [Rhodosporidiobolus nylandii]
MSYLATDFLAGHPEYEPFVDACRDVFLQLHPDERATKEQWVAYERWRDCLTKAMSFSLYLRMTELERRTVDAEVRSFRYLFPFSGFEQAPTPQRRRDVFPILVSMETQYPKYSTGDAGEAHARESGYFPDADPANPRHDAPHDQQEQHRELMRARPTKAAEHRKSYWSKEDVRRAFLDRLERYPGNSRQKNYTVPELDDEGRPKLDTNGLEKPVKVYKWQAVQNYIWRTTGVKIAPELIREHARTAANLREVSDPQDLNPYIPQPRAQNPQRPLAPRPPRSH